MKRARFTTLLFCGMFLLSVSTGWCVIAQTPWPMLQRDIYHTGQNTSYGLQLKNAKVKFGRSLGVSGVSQPIVDSDGTVYIVGDGCLYVVATDGSAECLFSGIDGPVEATPVLSSDGILYIPTANGTLHAVSREGSHLWALQFGRPLLSSPVLGPDGKIFIGSGPNDGTAEGSLHCISAEGEPLWDYATGSAGYNAPVVDQYGSVILASLRGVVYCFDADGDMLWNSDLGQGVVASPVIGADDTLYITTAASLVALDDSGLPKRDPFIPRITVFDELTDSGFAAGPAVDSDGNVYIGGILGDVYSLERGGAQRWAVMIKEMTLLDPMPVPILSPPTLDRKGRIYVRSADYIASLGGAAGDVQGFMKITESESGRTVAAESSPVLGLRRTLFLPYEDGSVYALCPKTRVLTISGTVTGELSGGIRIIAKALDETLETYETGLAENGSYLLQDLYPGRYIVTPVRPGLQFDPPSRTVQLGLSDLGNVNFTASPAGAVIVAAQATPSKVPNDGTTPVLFSATVEHALGPSSIASVVIDLSPIGGSAAQAMNDDGAGGDAVPGDGIYTCSAVIPESVTIQLAGLTVAATDTDGRGTQAVITIEVYHAVSGETSGSDTHTLNYQPAASCNGSPCGNTFDIQYQGDGPADSLKRAHVSSLQSSSLVLQVFRPSNTGATPDYERPIQQLAQKLRISNAQAGIWRYRIVNQGSGSAQYSVTTTTAGTGIIVGTVTDAETGASVDQALVSTSIGGSVRTQGGAYILLSPAGVMTLNESDSAHAPASLSVTLMAGGTVEANFLLLPKGSGTSGTCPVETALAGDDHALSLARLFRDRVLTKTARGRYAIATYYRFASEVNDRIASDPELRTALANAVRAVMPAVQDMLDGRKPSLTPRQRESVTLLLDRVRCSAPPALAAAIEMFERALRGGGLLEKLNPADDASQ